MRYDKEKLESAKLTINESIKENNLSNQDVKQYNNDELFFDSIKQGELGFRFVGPYNSKRTSSKTYNNGSRAWDKYMYGKTNGN